MINRSIWDILKIEQTKDKRKIKQAYAKQSAIYHPEDYPEEFKKIQKAYKKALDYSSNNCEYEETDSLMSDQIDTSLPKSKSNESIIDIDFRQITDTRRNIYSESKIDIDLEVLNQEDDHKHHDKEQPMIFDLEVLNQEDDYKHHDKEQSTIFDLEPINEEHKYDIKDYQELDVITDNDNESEYMEYILNRIDNQLKTDTSPAILRDIFYDRIVIRYLNIDEFKEKFQNVLLKYQTSYSKSSLKYIKVTSEHYELTKLRRKVVCKTRKNKILKLIFAIFIGIIVLIVSGMINGKKEENKVVNIDHQKIDDNNNLQSEFFEMYYPLNKPYLNGVIIENSGNEYWLYDENNNLLVDKPINKIEFTLSNMLVLEIYGDYYLYNTQTNILGEQAYNAIYVLDVTWAGKEKNTKELLINSNDDNWNICDLMGQEEINLDESVIIPLTPIKANIDENGVVTLS